MIDKNTIYNLLVCEDKVKELSKLEDKLEFDKNMIKAGYILDVASIGIYVNQLLDLNFQGVVMAAIGSSIGKTMEVIGNYYYFEHGFKKLVLTKKEKIKKD